VGRAQGPRFQAGPKPDPATSKVGGSPVRYGDIDPITKSSQEPEFRRIATRYDKTNTSFAATIYLTSTILALR
jgi:hypothetical protein